MTKPNIRLVPISAEQFMAVRRKFESLAPEQSRAVVDDYTSDQVCIELIQTGSAYHDPSMRLAWRGYTADQIRAFFDASVDKGSKRWTERYREIDAAVASAGKKHAARINSFFSEPWVPPAGCIPHWDPNAPVPEPAVPEPVAAAKTPEERKKAQKELGKAIGAGEYEIDLRPTIMSLDQMADDLVFVGSTGDVVHLPTMRVRSATRAKDEYAASQDTYVNPETGERKSAPAFKLWMEHPFRKSVDLITWSPSESTFCRAPELEQGGDSAVNLWRGWPERKVPDDWEALVKPFLEHIHYLIPDPTDAHEFIQWMAHIVQRPGELPHRFYLMVAEAQGVGRNWLSTGVCPRLFAGHCAVDINLDNLLSPNPYNGALSRKVMATVDEVREGIDAGNRHQRAQKLKNMITTPVRAINPKYGSQSREYNCLRWLMLSNHPDALPIDNTDRRCVVIFNPKAPREEAYYDWIYGVVHDWRFINSVWQYLAEYDISDFNAQKPARMTDAKRRVVDAMADPLVKAMWTVQSEFEGNLIDKDTLLEMVKDELETNKSFHSSRWSKAFREAGFLQRSTKVQIIPGGKRVYVYCMGGGTTQEQLDEMDVTEIRAAVVSGKAGSRFG